MKKIAEWTVKHPALYLGAFILIYFTWFNLLEKYVQPVIYLHTPLDYEIPFIKYFIVPYYMWFPYIAGMTLFFLFRSRTDFQNVTRYMFAGMILALTIYTVIPNGLHLRPVITDTDIFSRMVSALYNSDTPTNVCPSLHVYNSIAMNTVVQRSEAFRHSRLIKTLSLILCICIVLSTMFLKQHSVIDVFWGMVMALALYPLSYRSFFETSRAHHKEKLTIGD